ncbi:uncharacterized protein ASPGLDRAFT_54323 [Aspergillus glaucus CBS 516.65]|uniref:Uncharacterized protein n=1 Tax=Aspergillus glaucus CBS 516.65 TaxID=1160497 RepID=A0A1L9VWF1_ASPGL|nr:hypothetical protein ASPGLDRAFT_54323 [Aspergillus glaucus CBS 516.65]OJJ88229.1 hypothetical protein ASPGLDRAFT_54323 [Aspergillus glaucus CBS 516.65]
MAARGGHESVIRLLFEHGACASFGRGMMNDTPLISAAREHHRGAVEALGNAIREDPPIDNTSLWWKFHDASADAARWGDLKVLQFLLGLRTSLGLSPFAWHPRVGTDLHTRVSEAAKGGHIECVRWLLARGTGPDESAEDTHTLERYPIYLIIAKGNLEIASLTLEHMDFGLLERLYVQFPCEQDNLLYIALAVGSENHVEVALERDWPRETKNHSIATDMITRGFYKGDVNIMKALFLWCNDLDLNNGQQG